MKLTNLIKMIWFINNKEQTMFRANDNQGERQLERTDLGRMDSSEQVDRANEPDTIKILHYY